MNCIGIWLTHTHPERHGPKPDELECHFNLWMLNRSGHRRRRECDCFLDIGIMLSHADDSTHINIFIPGRIDKPNILDLGVLFRDRTELVSAVFNEDYAVLARAGEKTIEVQKTDTTRLFDIYMLDIDSDVSIESQFGGSTARIRIPEHLKDRKHYYRIRLTCAFVDLIGHTYTPPASSILEGAFFQTELIDFRVNENRNLPVSLRETIRQHGNIHFTKTHLFLMREASDDYVFSHKPPSGRQLEKDTWKTYVGLDRPFEHITAYHWKDTAPHSSFSMFVKFRSFQSNMRTVLITVGVIVVVGIISGCLGNLLYSLTTVTPSN